MPRCSGPSKTSLHVTENNANEENGNYVLTAFMSFSAPTGDDGNSNRHGVFILLLRAARALAHFDIQSTAGISLAGWWSPALRHAARVEHRAAISHPQLFLA